MEIKRQKFLQLAAKIALKSGCVRGKRGVVAVENEQVLLSAYNQVWLRQDYCQKKGCVRDVKRLGLGKSLEVCDSIHSEANLVASAARKGISLKGVTLYSTCLPCPICARLVAACGIKKIFYLDRYGDEEAKKLLRQAKIAFERVNLPGDDPGRRLRDTKGQKNEF